MFLSCCAEGFANFAMRKIVLLKQLLFIAILLRKNPPMDSSFTDDDVSFAIESADDPSYSSHTNNY